MPDTKRTYKALFLCFFAFFILTSFLYAAEPKELTLKQAVMCEEIDENYLPVGKAVVFSIERGKVFCFTHFDPVPARTFIYHVWYHKDVLVTKKRLVLKPEKWTTKTELVLRESDKGPWRVEIADKEDKVLDTLRFNVTD